MLLLACLPGGAEDLGGKVVTVRPAYLQRAGAAPGRIHCSWRSCSLWESESSSIPLCSNSEAENTEIKWGSFLDCCLWPGQHWAHRASYLVIRVFGLCRTRAAGQVVTGLLPSVSSLVLTGVCVCHVELSWVVYSPLAAILAMTLPSKNKILVHFVFKWK